MTPTNIADDTCKVQCLIYRFPGKQRFRSKIRKFSYPVYLSPLRGLPLEFYNGGAFQKLEGEKSLTICTIISTNTSTLRRDRDGHKKNSKTCWLSLSLSLSTLSILTAIFWWTWVSRCLLKQRMMEVMVTTGYWSYKSCKVQIITTNKSTSIFYRPNALPIAQPTVSEHWDRVTEEHRYTQYIQWYHFQWPWVTSDLDFKVTIFFDIEYLRNDTR